MDWRSPEGQQILSEAREMHSRGEGSWREIGEQFGLTELQVKRAHQRFGAEKKPPTLSRSESVVLLISDQHCGKETPSFNADVLAQRMDTLQRNVLRIVDIIGRSYDFKALHVLNLGDHIDGDQIYKTHPHHVDRRAAYGRAQVKTLVDIMAPVLQPLAARFGKLYMHGVPGNHGAVSRWTHEANNWDLMYYDYLGMAMKGTGVEVKASDDFYAIPEIEGHGFLMYHGRGIRMYQNIPWYGATQRVMRWAGSMPRPFLAACFGHFHTVGNQWWLGKEIFFNGTPVSDDDFPMEVLGMDGVPRYWLLGVHEERGITWQYKIDLI